MSEPQGMLRRFLLPLPFLLLYELLHPSASAGGISSLEGELNTGRAAQGGLESPHLDVALGWGQAGGQSQLELDGLGGLFQPK